MADLKILKKDGYVELDGVQGAISSRDLDLEALWAAVGRGDTDGTALVLFEAGFGRDGEEPADIKDVIVLAVPDDRMGSRHRIWVRRAGPAGR